MNYKFYKVGFFILLIIIIILMIFGPISNRSEDVSNPVNNSRDTTDSAKPPIKKPEDRRRTVLPPAE